MEWRSRFSGCLRVYPVSYGCLCPIRAQVSALPAVVRQGRVGGVFAGVTQGFLDALFGEVVLPVGVKRVPVATVLPAGLG
jgi:hypothetical protein